MIANFFSNKNSNFGFLLVSDSLKVYPIRELEFRDCKTFARVPPRAISLRLPDFVPPPNGYKEVDFKLGIKGGGVTEGTGKAAITFISPLPSTLSKEFPPASVA